MLPNYLLSVLLKGNSAKGHPWSYHILFYKKQYFSVIWYLLLLLKAYRLWSVIL